MKSIIVMKNVNLSIKIINKKYKHTITCSKIISPNIK
jgi:hypothetical protein